MCGSSRSASASRRPVHHRGRNEGGRAAVGEHHSQFIEHLGRCIYGGIWAEMLEDRNSTIRSPPSIVRTRPPRSAFPVVGRSPWEIVGPADAVTMNTSQPFVGRHTPMIGAGAGIRQHALGVTQGSVTWATSGWRPEAESLRRSRSALPGRRPGSPRALCCRSEKPPVTAASHWPSRRDDHGQGGVRDRGQGRHGAGGTVSLMRRQHRGYARRHAVAPEGVESAITAGRAATSSAAMTGATGWETGIGGRRGRTGLDRRRAQRLRHARVRPFCQLVEAEPWITVNTGFGRLFRCGAARVL